MHPQQVVKLQKYHYEQSTDEVCWGEGRMRRVRMGMVVSERVRMRVGLRSHAFIWGRMGMGMMVEANVSSSEGR